MKNFFTILLISVFLISCSKNTNELLDLLPVKTIVNPNIKILIGDINARLIKAQAKENGIIKGFTDKYFFQTTDNFESFSYSPYSFPVLIDELTIDQDRMWTVKMSMNNISVVYSNDFGKNWNSFSTNINEMIPAPELAKFMGEICFLNNNEILFTINTAENSWDETSIKYKTWIYRINLITNDVVLLSSIDNYQTHSIAFHNNEILMIIKKLISRGGGAYDTQNSYLVRSTDAGASWNEPILIDYNFNLNLLLGPGSSQFAYLKNRNATYSADGGNTWNLSSFQNPPFTNVQFTENLTLYASTENLPYKSIDGGNSWISIDRKVYGAQVQGDISFVDKDHGIVYDKNQLFITEDGGTTWKVLLSKYSYIN
ncbi:MAG: exo-alpha-sialidase [Chitinophagaceae bacterium]|nr:exo-alpha-sialidase [Chitinophagaceae bacterium]